MGLFLDISLSKWIHICLPHPIQWNPDKSCNQSCSFYELRIFPSVYKNNKSTHLFWVWKFGDIQTSPCAAFMNCVNFSHLQKLFEDQETVEADMWKKIEDSYKVSTQEITEVLKKRITYLKSLKIWKDVWSLNTWLLEK